MEKARNGSSPPFLSNDVNKNGTSSTFHIHPQSEVTADTAAPLSNVNRKDAALRDSRESGTTENIRSYTVNVGSMKMLDLVTDGPSGGTVSNCVIPNPCTDSATNMFTRSIVVASKLESSAINAVNQEEMDENALQGLSLAEKNHDFSAKGLETCYQPLNYLTAAEPVESHSCNRQFEQSFTAALRTRPDGLSNGVTDYVIQSSLSSDTVIGSQINRSTTTDKEAKIVNGGLLTGHSSVMLHTETVVTIISDGTATCLSNSQCEKPSSSTAAGEDKHTCYIVREEPDGAGAQPRARANVAGDLSDDATPKQGLPLRPAAADEPTPAGQFGDDLSSSPPPPAVRTRTMTDSRSYDSSAALGPGEQDEEEELVAKGHSDLRFMDVSLSSRNTFESSRRQSAPGHIPEGLSVPTVETSALALQSKRPGIAEYFGRSLFSKKQREPKGPSQNVPGWKLFGKVPARESPPKDPRTIQQEYEARVGKAGPGATSAGTSPTQPQQTRRKNLEFEPLSTTALILEDRPANLPAKSVEEALRHRQEYDEMVAEAKKRELYEIFLSRAKERWRSFSEMGSDTEADDGASLADRESSLELIKLDISRTFPPLFIFQKGGPYHDLLHSVLGAYTCYRPDVGYVQGMSFIAAVLILNLEEADAFIAFANLLNKPCQLAFFRVDHDLMLKYFAAFEVFFEENLPKLYNHFQKSNLTPDLYLIDWIFTLYSKSLPLDVACRVWDVFCRDGEEFLFRTGLGILRLYEDVLLQMDFIHSAQFLTRLPEDIASDRLFACIAATPMLNGNRKWSQVSSSKHWETRK
uniref:Rab-GAP TBC domain-containing protein n=1 Tax=Esox lucius TaxID=8010 RepID=A0A3P8ZH78_ESOLU